MKRFTSLGLLILSGCSQSKPENTTVTVPTPEPQSALNPQSNASAKNNQPPETDASSNTCPAGATAACKDGSYTDSSDKKKACAQHGGVARWCTQWSVKQK